MRHHLHSIFKAAAEAVLPPLSQSQFSEKGVLTPAEFVQAGDYLVRTCPTWAWCVRCPRLSSAREQIRSLSRFREGGDPKKKRNFLPADKQYLVTRNGEVSFAIRVSQDL